VTDEVIVRMGELAVSGESASVLTALGLGSCIAVCAYDPMLKVGGMAHVVLPEAVGKSEGLPAKSADIGVPNLIDAVIKAGALRSRLKIVIAGGAQLFSFQNACTHMDIGRRNIQAVENILKNMGFRLVASDLGGSTGRTVRLHVDTGVISMRKVGEPEKTLAQLKMQRAA
jgi:chemotaxis protein CheD